MADYKHGEMNTDVQVTTFNGFLKTVTWGAVISILILIFAAVVNG